MPQSFAVNPPKNNLTQLQSRIAFAIAAYAFIIGIIDYALVWYLVEDGISPVNLRLPYWDFSNLWSGSRLVIEGKLDLIFDPETYRREISRLHGLDLTNQEWSYPPSLLLLGVPLALFPIWFAYIVWSAGTLYVWHLAVQQFQLPKLAHFFVVFSPAAITNLSLGQNDALMAAFLIGGLVLAPKRPIIAGVLFGLLTLKPHLGLLVPFCLIASWNVRAILSATATTVLIIIVTGLAFGFNVWTEFFEVTRPLMIRIMEAPFPQGYHAKATTAFVLLRSLGSDVSLAYAAQLPVIVLSVGLTIYLWHRQNMLDHGSRVALTGVLVVLATPYGYTYDCLPLYLAIAWFLFRLKRPNLLLLGGVWCFPYIMVLTNELFLSLGFIAPALLTTWLFVRLRGEMTASRAPDLTAS
ncbi:DUF2029 domain-containing protein [Pseudohoeflea suaedae]|uniref:DUF2029 domain-containing protein n=1 Tax=Pseudohoeflea suaedae TaxID=877384 RepID=A0A4R5PLK8_9HYPH|nr:glycosyltransferase family 87 protein [Pseudohoeflea suaedae]TDH37834.1 DUF2029 domain-containing protein [Pseudohoeflea suaedae]